MSLVYGVRESPIPVTKEGILEELEFLARERRDKLIDFWPAPMPEERLKTAIPAEDADLDRLLLEERSLNYRMREAWCDAIASVAHKRRSMKGKLK